MHASSCPVPALSESLARGAGAKSLDAVLADACRWFDDTIPHEAKDDVTKFREESREFLDDPSVEEAADAVPTTWLDDLLTGPTSVGGEPPFGCPQVEAILRGVKARILAIEAPRPSARKPRRR